MKVKMLSTAAGPDGVWAQHSVQDLVEAVALELVRTGHAILVPAAEAAVVETPEAGMTPEEQAILAPVEVAGSRRSKKNAPA